MIKMKIFGKERPMSSLKILRYPYDNGSIQFLNENSSERAGSDKTRDLETLDSF